MNYRPKAIITAVNFIKYAFLSVYSLMILYPLLFIFMSSLKSNDEIFLKPFALPQVWDFKIYYELWTRYDVRTYFINSLYYAVVSVSICIVVSSMAAYALTRLKWKLKTPVFSLILLGLMVPIHSEIVPLYIVFTMLGLKNPRINLVLLFIAFSIPITVFLISSFIKGLPLALEEAAVIEGSGLLRAFFTIIVPLLKPVLATVIIFDFLAVWNDFFTSLIFISQDSDKTLQLGISRFTGNYATKYSELLAAVMITIIPSTFVYMILQEKIISGLTAGAVKG